MASEMATLARSRKTQRSTGWTLPLRTRPDSRLQSGCLHVRAVEDYCTMLSLWWTGVGPTCRPDPAVTCFAAVDGLWFLLIGTASLSLDRRRRDHFDRADIIGGALRAEDAVIVRRQSHTERGRIHTGVDGG